MPYTDRHGRPEILMHPNIARGVASYRRETPVDQTARDDDARAGTDVPTPQPAAPIAK